ncbi:rod shape-determining protein [Kribbella sp. CA-294648]|uniref:rod shape-determining protein n=1 Tax=Kribbella sp. CA-294648 TaxID=3239948 RepID=UPI003D8E41A4
MTSPGRAIPQRRLGTWWACGRSNGIAIDLGSARTRAWMPDTGLTIDAPTTIPAGASHTIPAGASGTVPAGASGTILAGASGINRPVQRGVVVDLPGASRCLDHLLGRRAGLGRYSTVILITPLLCADPHRSTAVAALEVLDARTVLTIASVKAAALGARADLTRPLLVVDIGAGLTEVGLLVEGRVAEACRLELGTSDLGAGTSVAGLVESIVGAVTDLLRLDCGVQVVDALDRGLLLTGGGALRPEITYRLSKQLKTPARPAAAPQVAALRGAGLALSAARRHPSRP